MKARHYLHPLNYRFSRRNSQLHNCGNVFFIIIIIISVIIIIIIYLFFIFFSTALFKQNGDSEQSVMQAYCKMIQVALPHAAKVCWIF